jgi:hypothetical protein
MRRLERDTDSHRAERDKDETRLGIKQAHRN